MRDKVLFVTVLFAIVFSMAQSVHAENAIAWKFIEGSRKTHVTGWNPSCSSHISYNAANNRIWQGVNLGGRWSDGDGEGFSMNSGDSENDSQMGVFSLWQCVQKVPAYATLTMHWTFDMGIRSKKHQVLVSLYACDNLETLKSMDFQFMNQCTDCSEGAAYLVGRHCAWPTKEKNNVQFSAAVSHNFVFDNRYAESPQEKAWYLLSTYVVGNKGSRTDAEHTWGSFRQRLTPSWTYNYYKYISFSPNVDPNGYGAYGSMGMLTVVNSGTLTANAFSRPGYVFRGWNTKPDGSGTAYADGAAVTASNGDAGYVNLYAQWVPQPAISRLEFSQAKGQVLLEWNPDVSYIVNGEWIVYRDNISIATLPKNQLSYADTQFTYETTLKYKVAFHPTTGVTGLESAERSISTQRHVYVDNVTCSVNGTVISFEWDTDAYLKSLGHKFEVYAGNELLYTIYPEDNQTRFRWEHRSENIGQRANGQAGQVYWTAEPIDICSPHTYTIKGMIGTKVLDAATIPNIAIATGTEFLSMEASKGLESDQGSVVRLDWSVNLHGATTEKTYTISRRCLDKNETEWTTLPQEKTSTDRYTYYDKTVSPGHVYEYQVQVEDNCGDGKKFYTSTRDIGYAPVKTGTISGRITYGASNMAVPGVTVEAMLSDLGKPYHALRLNSQSAKVLWTYPNDDKNKDYAKNLFKQPFTIQLWVNPDVLVERTIVDLQKWSMGMTNAGELFLSKGEKPLVFDQLKLQAGKYNHVTLTRNGNTLTVYIITTDATKNPIIQAQQKEIELPEVTAASMTIGGYEGYVDEFRLWTKVMSQEDIVDTYDHVLAGDEMSLETYWSFDEGSREVSFDQSGHQGHNCSHQIDVESTTTVPSELALKTKTDANGNYSIKHLTYAGGNGTSYTIVPSLGIHRFNPTGSTYTVSENARTINNVNFVDESSFPVSGRVVYAKTDYPVAGCTFYIDDSEEPCIEGKTAIVTDAKGEFSISVPIGKHFIRVKKDGHVFTNGGRYPEEEGTGGLMMFNDEVRNLTFHDETLVNLTGRVVGGNIEGKKMIGFGQSVNNIGVATLTLGLTDNAYRLNVLETKNGTVVDVQTNPEIDSLSNAKPQTIKSTAWRGAGDNCNKLYIRTDSLTGEFSALVPPLNYNVAMYIPSSGVDPLNGQKIELNLTNPLTQHKDSIPADSASTTWQYYSYHTALRQICHAEPVFTVHQKDHPDGSFGIDNYEVKDALGTIKVNDIHTVNEAGQVQYNYGGPLFISLDRYQFEMEGYEQFVNKDSGKDIVSRVPLADMWVKVDNALAINSATENTQFQLDSTGKATYIWQADLPLITSDYKRSLTVSFGESDGMKEGLSIKDGIVLGASPTGNNFVTEGPPDVDMILRDPPGSQSFATWTKGSVTTYKTLNSLAETGDYSKNDLINMTPTISLSFTNSSNISVGGEVSGGPNLILNSFSNQWEWTSSNTYSKTVSFTEAFSTSDSPEYDGADGDIFIGTSTNIIIGTVHELSLFRDTVHQEKAAVYIKDNYAQGITFPTAFAYSQHEIEHGLIPALLKIRNELLIIVPDTSKVNTNTSDKPIYVTQLNQDNPSFGATDTYKIIKPGKDDKALYSDSISSLNMQIEAWKNVLANNEKEKVRAALQREHLAAIGKVTNRSFDAGSSVTITTTVETDTVESTNSFVCHSDVLEGPSDNTGGFSILGLGFRRETSAHAGTNTTINVEKERNRETTFSYTLRDNDPGDVISVDVYTDQGVYQSPIFHTRAGKTSNPYEGEVVAHYFEPEAQHVIMDATMQVEKPSIEVVKATMTDIPSGSPALYELHLANVSDAGADCMFRLMVADETNPDGAQLFVDGRVITDNNRLISIPNGQTIVKTLQLTQSNLSILHYDDIAIVLASQQQSDPTSNMAIIADTVKISAHFVPSASPVTLALNMTTMNTQTGTDLVLTMKDFNRNYYQQKAFRMQYKPQGGDWTTFHEYVLHTEDLTDSNELLPANGSMVSYTLPMISYADVHYLFRIASVSTFGLDEVFVYSNEIELIKNPNRPRPLGLAEPTDGILDIGDELSITFNEEFVSGELTKTRNFLVTGVLNGAPVEHRTALRLYENALAAKTEATVNLGNKDFSLDMWVNIHSNGILLSHGTAKDMQVGTDDQGHLMIQVEQNTLFSQKVLPHDKWLFLTLSYHREATQGLLSASVAYDDVTEQLFQNRLVPLYKDRGPLFVGGGAAGAIHELLLWDEAHDIASALAQRSVTKNPATPHLIGYWKMNEGEGRTIRDYSRNRHMNTTDANWYLNNVNKALTLDGTHHFAAYTGNVPPMPTDDYAAELWFKAGKQNGEAQLFQLGEVGLYIDTNGKLHLQSGANDQMVNGQMVNGQWHHVLLNVHRMGTAAVYVDGERALTVSADKIGDLASDSLRIGPFQGAVDEIRLWQATLQSDMLASNRKQRLRGDEPGLSLYYPFEKKSLDEYNQVIVSGTMEEFTGHGEEAVISGQPSAISYSDEAPALKEKPTETNVSFSFIASNTKIVIDIDEEPARIEGCMLNITVRDVRSNTGNYSLPATWTAFVHRNELTWQDSELSIINYQLSTNLINRSGTPQRWTLSELPAWLTVNATSGMLNPMQQQSLTFRVSETAPIGKHEIAVYAMGNNGIETPLTLHITITGNLPDWTVNPADYENSMSVIAQLDFFGEISEDEDDIVAAFIGDECRGIAQPEYKERYDAYYLTMIIYGDSTTDNKTVSFRAYKASTGVIYTQVTPSDSIRSKALSFVGSYKEPVMLSAKDRIEQRLALRQGWNWISLSVKADDMRPQAILQDIADDIVAIKGHQDETQGIDVGFMTHTDTGWDGYMEPLLNRRSYMIKAKRDCELRIVGTSVEPATHTVRIHSNWGWPGYFGQQRIALADAFADADPQPGDIVRTQRAAAYYDDYEWVGSLQALEPGQGYAYYSVTNEEKWFAYPSSSVAAAPRRNEKMRKYENEEIVNDFAYPYNMILVGQVLLDNEPAANARIAVFDGDECRSIGYTDDDGNLLMLVAGEDEATLSYKLILNDQVFETVQTLHYVTDAIVGTPDSPHLIRFGEGQSIDSVTGDGTNHGWRKVLMDGTIYLIRDGKTFTVLGVEVK